MKTLPALAAGMLLSAAILQKPALAQGTAFTYQGQLQANGSPVNGTYNLQFSLYAGSTGGPALAGPITINGVNVTNGLFTTIIDFGSGVWTGATNWLQIGVETNGASPFMTLSPRQELTPTPYAIFAEGASAAGLSGTIPTSSLSGAYTGAVNLTNPGNSFAGSGSALTSLNASKLTIGQVPPGALGNAWKLTGNTGANPTNGNFLGTTDNLPLELWVNGSRGFRLQPNSNAAPAVVAGSSSNSIDDGAGGTAIGGGEGNSIQYLSSDTAIVCGYSNQVMYSCLYSTIGGGTLNTLQPNADYCFIAGGYQNQIEPVVLYCSIGGGAQNDLQTYAQYSSIGGGRLNQIQWLATYSSIAGGENNTIHSNVNLSFIGGGWENSLLANYSAIAGGQFNTIASNSDWSVIAGGNANNINGGSSYSFIGGGNVNTIDTNAFRSAIGGGLFNDIQPGAQYSFIGGGDNNHDGTNAADGVIGGGSNNTIEHDAQWSAILGGLLNDIQPGAQNSFIGGGDANTIGAQSFYATIAGGGANFAAQDAATVSGGVYNNINGIAATIAGGETNYALNDYASVGGGYGNYAQGYAATVAGGFSNSAAGAYSFAAGQSAEALNEGSFVWADASGGAFSSTANNQFAVRAAGGALFEANVEVGGGGADYRQLSLGGGNSTGYLYGAFHPLGDGIHLGYNFYYDSSGIPHVSNAGGSTSRLTVGYGFISLNVGAIDSPPTNQMLVANSTGVTVFGNFNNFSDRNAKQDFAPVSPSQILEEVLALPVSEWSYKTDSTTRHIGPMAQDFYSIFNIGTDDRHIAPIDEGGVALAAIQGLNRKLDERDKTVERQAAEIHDLKARLERIEELLASGRRTGGEDDGQ